MYKVCRISISEFKTTKMFLQICILSLDKEDVKWKCCPWESFISGKIKTNPEFHEKYNVEVLNDHVLQTPMKSKYGQVRIVFLLK